MWIKLCVFFSLLLVIYAYPSGPPKSVCGNGLPVHMKDGKPIPPQETASPYVIELNSTYIKPGETVRVKIHSYQGEMFRGLFLQMYPIPNTEDESVKYVAAGLFDRKIRNIKIMTCTIMLDTLTHDDSFMKIETSFDWRAPLYLKHDMVVRATILKNFDTYWHNVESPRIEVVKDRLLTVEKLEKPWLEEIIKTVKNEDNEKARQELVRARFERGFRHAIDPNGFVMVNYITNLLPFEDSPVPAIVVSDASSEGNKSLDPMSSGNISMASEQTNQNITADSTGTQTGNESQTVNQTSPERNFQTSLDADAVTTLPDIDGDQFSVGIDDTVSSGVGMNATVDTSNIKNKSMMKNYYQVLVRSLLKGDKLVADTLSEIIERN